MYKLKFIALSLGYLMSITVFADTHTWTGLGADNLWSNSANWDIGVPASGDDLIFTGTVQTTTYNDFDPATYSFSSITLTGAIGNCADFTLQGNDIVVSGGDITNKAGDSGVGGYRLNIYNNIIFINTPPTITITNTGNNIITLWGNINNSGLDITIENEGTILNVGLEGIISGAGGIIKNGTASVIFDGANTYTGNTILNAGTILLNNWQSLGIGGTIFINGGSFRAYPNSVTLNNHPIEINADFSLVGTRNVNLGNGAVTLNTDINFNVTNGRFLTIGGDISGNYSISKTGDGYLQFNGSNVYSGNTTINEGTLILGSSSALGDATQGTTILAGAVLDLYGQNYTSTEPLIINTTLSGAIINSSTNAGSYNGLITLGSDSYINATNGDINIVNTGNLTGNYNLTLGGVKNGTFHQSIRTNSAEVIKLGSGNWTLVSNNYYTGATTISEGTLILQGDYRSSSFSVNASAVIELNRDTDLYYSTVTTFSGNGTLRKSGVGKVVWQNVVAFNLGSGALVEVLGGRFVGGSTNNLENWTLNKSDLYVGAGCSFAIYDTIIYVDAVSGMGTIDCGHTITIGVDNGSGDFGGSITNYYATPGKLVKVGTGTQILSGVSTYTGETIISEGCITIGVDNALPNSGNVTINSILDLNGYNLTLGSITGNGIVDNISAGGSPTFVYGSNNLTTTFAGVIQNSTGVVNVTKVGAGTVYYDGNHTYSGQTYIEDGFIEIRNGSISSW